MGFAAVICTTGIVALDDHFADRANYLVSHPRAAFLVQQVHVNRLIFDEGIVIDRNADKAEA